MKTKNFVVSAVAFSLALGLAGCGTEKAKNKAKEAAAKYWQDKAYPGKSYDVQVIEAEKGEGGTYRVKGIVDGETRVGSFNPDTENFSEGYYSMAHEKGKKVAELEQEVKYWKEKAEGFEKEIFKLKVQMKAASGKKVVDEDDKKSE
ncbi:MAG: hypothetical protein JNL01_04740 [Bdellovibrionales bacterium]|nr:hypothetical protein [Bdellovibrionales bacterium]